MSSININPTQNGNGWRTQPMYTFSEVAQLSNVSVGTVRNWLKCLKPGGKLEIEVPDGVWAAENFAEVEKNGGNEFAECIVYGLQSNPLDFHKTGFSERKFRHIAAACRHQLASHRIRTVFPKTHNQQVIRFTARKKDANGHSTVRKHRLVERDRLQDASIDSGQPTSHVDR